MQNEEESCHPVCGLERIFSLNDVVLKKENNQMN